MKKLIIIGISAFLFSGCQLDAKKPWIIVRKHRCVEYQNEIGICHFKLSDGWNDEYFDDSCSVLNIGDTVHGKKIIKN